MSASSSPYSLIERYSCQSTLEENPASVPVSSELDLKIQTQFNRLLEGLNRWESVLFKEISKEQLFEVVKFIETNPFCLSWIQAKGGGFLERDPKLGLPRTLFISKSGEIRINCKRHEEGSTGIGQGKFKTVTLAIHYQEVALKALSSTRLPEEDPHALLRSKRPL